MEGLLRIQGINSNGYDDQNMELKLNYDSRSTLESVRKFICDTSLVKYVPEKIILIKRNADGNEEKLEDLSQRISKTLSKTDSLKYFVLPYVSPEIFLKLNFDKEALKWISAQKIQIRLLIGNTKDFQVNKHIFVTHCGLGHLEFLEKV